MAAALAAVPLADAGLRYAADFSKSIVAQVSDALRTPLLRSETTTTRTTKRGTIVRQSGVSVPAWAVVAGGLVAAWWFSSSKPSSGGGFEWNPLTGILGGLLPH